jgi:hypothetical protein
MIDQNATASGLTPGAAIQILPEAFSPPPPPCPSCGASTWTSLALSDGTVKGIAKCNACAFERDIIHDPFHGPTAVTAEQVSPWESHRAAVVDLRWFYSEADGDLGAHSSWDSKVQQAIFGVAISAAIELLQGEPTAATPSDGKIWAAKRWVRIRGGLRAIPRPMQALAEWVFSLRRPSTQIAGIFDREIEPVISYLLATRQVTLKGMKDPSDRAKIRRLAEGAIEAVLSAYEAAQRAIAASQASLDPSHSDGRSRRREREYAQAGPRGASSRRLVPVEAPRTLWLRPAEEA